MTENEEEYLRGKVKLLDAKITSLVSVLTRNERALYITALKERCKSSRVDPVSGESIRYEP